LLRRPSGSFVCDASKRNSIEGYRPTTKAPAKAPAAEETARVCGGRGRRCATVGIGGVASTASEASTIGGKASTPPEASTTPEVRSLDNAGRRRVVDGGRCRPCNVRCRRLVDGRCSRQCEDGRTEGERWPASSHLRFSFSWVDPSTLYARPLRRGFHSLFQMAVTERGRCCSVGCKEFPWRGMGAYDGRSAET
jgi:hypothetical protein